MKINISHVFVVGMGEVGTRLAGALEVAGVGVTPVTRTSGWDQAASDRDGLRLVCVREEALASVLDRLATVPGERIVLVQNGWIRSCLDSKNDASRGLIWFTSKGDFYKILRPSPFSGPQAADLALALAAGGIPATSEDAATFDRLDADKMGFNCVVGLPLAVHGLSLADYLEHLPEEAEQLFSESVAVCARAVGQEPDPRWWPDFLASAEPLGWVSASRAKALEFRNGAVVRLAQEQGLDAPVNRRLLDEHAG